MVAIAIFLVAAGGGAVAAVSGFGIGSLLTPLMAGQMSMRTAVAVVSVPHLAGTAIRFWRMRRHVDVGVLRRFGVPSAVGGLAGALLQGWASNPVLTVVLGALLILAGALQLSGQAGRWRLHGTMAQVAGVASGFFGGLVGNQGGIRSAGMLGFDITKEQFVATATAVALIVDAARMPVYLYLERGQIETLWPWMVVGIAGVAAGTLAGGRVLTRIPEPRFRQIVGVILVLLGISMLT